MEMSDQKRAWYDARDCGTLSKSHPFQSAVCTTSVMSTKKSSDYLDGVLLEFCKSTPKKYTLSIQNDAVDGYLNDSYSKFANSDLRDKKTCVERSIADGIALADDLYASNENLSKVMINAHSKELDQMRDSMNEALAAAAVAQEKIKSMQTNQMRSNSTEHLVNQTNSKSNVNSVSNSASNGTLNNTSSSTGNKFRSAKDQFAAQVPHYTYVLILCIKTEDIYVHWKQGGQLKEPNSGLVQTGIKRAFSGGTNYNTSNNPSGSKKDLPPLPPELENYDRDLIDKIVADIIDSGHPVTFDDISGLEFAKKCVTELICWYALRSAVYIIYCA